MECVVRGIPIYYEEVGAGRPVVMLHDWAIDRRYMRYHWEPIFAQRPGWRRIYPDLPGSGRTPGADWITRQDDMLEVVLEFLDIVAPGESFAIVGASYGGYLARGIVSRRRTRMSGVMLSVPDIEVDRAKRRVPEHQVLVHNPDFVAALQEDEQRVVQIAVVQSPEYLADFRAAIKPAIAAADNTFLERLEATYAFSFDVDALPEPFPAPVLIVAGRQDSLCGYQDAWSLLDNYPRATFAVLDRAGHGLSVEQKTLFRALAEEWLDRVEEYAAST